MFSMNFIYTNTTVFNEIFLVLKKNKNIFFFCLIWWINVNVRNIDLDEAVNKFARIDIQ